MIKPATRNIVVTQGVTYDDTFTRYTGATVVNGEVIDDGEIIDMTGFRVNMEVWELTGLVLGAKVLDFDSDSLTPGPTYGEEVEVGGADGVVTFSADLQGLPIGKYFFSYFETDTAGVKRCIFKGHFTVERAEVNADG